MCERLTDLPDKALMIVEAAIAGLGESPCVDRPFSIVQRPADISEKVCHQNRIFEQIPIAESECSVMLRPAVGEHIVISFICHTIWGPFFSEYLGSNYVHDSVLPAMHSSMAKAGRDFQPSVESDHIEGIGQARQHE